MVGQTLNELGYNGTWTSPLVSPKLPTQKWNTIQYNIYPKNNIVFKLYRINAETTIGTVAGTPELFYETEISSGTNWHKRFVVPAFFSYYEITSTDTAPLNEIQVFCYGHHDTGYDAAAFPNSIVTFDNPTNLVLNGNDFHLDLVRDLHSEFKKINIAGAIESVSEVGTDKVVGLDETFNMDETAEDLYITVSGQDSTAGTGAQGLIIIYNDSNNERQEITLLLSGIGTNPLQIGGVNVPVTMVERAFVNRTGTLGSNENDITFHNLGNTKRFNIIPAGENISRATLFRVPADKVLVISDSSISGYSTVPGIISFVEGFSNGGTPTTQIQREIGRFRIVTNATQYTYNIDAKVSAGEFLQVVFKPDTAPPYPAGTCDISVTLNGMLCPLPNSY